VYDACQTADNFLSFVNNHSIQQIYLSGNRDVRYNQVPASDATDCCNQCFANSNCAASAFLRQIPLGTGYTCALAVFPAGQCTAPGLFSFTAEIQTNVGEESGVQYVVSNGFCGIVETIFNDP
jgi:hypothetical protein